MLHGASPDEAVSARGPIPILGSAPLFGLLKSMTSTEQFFVFLKNLFIYPIQCILKSIITKQKRNAMQQCHARFYYYYREGYHQEVPESYPEHPFDRGFHFSFEIVFTTVRAIWQP